MEPGRSPGCLFGRSGFQECLREGLPRPDSAGTCHCHPDYKRLYTNDDDK